MRLTNRFIEAGKVLKEPYALYVLRLKGRNSNTLQRILFAKFSTETGNKVALID